MKPTQTELTAKRFKAMQIVGSIGFFAGLILLGLSIANGGEFKGITPLGSIAIIATSIFTSYTSKALAWWFHR